MTQTSDALLAQMHGLHPVAVDMSLDRVRRLLSVLGHPEQNLPPVVHIAGTNGKGSTLAMIRAGLEAAGQSVHAYTSPHLVRFHERIMLNGAPISEPDLVEALSLTLERNAGEGITFFEASTLAGFWAFAKHPADTLLLEVGLGGRLDVTNVVDEPLLTIITPIDLDHQDFLGETLAEIAGEKAGILKRGVPCVVGRQQDEALEVIEAKAARLGVPLLAHGQHWHVWEERGRLVFQDENGLLDLPLPALRGAHQIENAGTALAALRHLGHSEDTCARALSDATWPARMQRLDVAKWMDLGHEIWLDGGHNPAAGRALGAVLGALPKRRTHAILGMMQTKDSVGFLSPLVPYLTDLQAVPIHDATPARSPEDLVKMAQELGLDATTATSADEAIHRLEPGARVVICGSLYLAGAVLRDAENGVA